jgi:hypothetical protein
MSRIDQADKVVGDGNVIITAGAYKDAEEKTRYKFGIRLTLPTFTDDLREKLFQVGLHRVMSVKAAGTFNKANDFGTLADAEAFASQFSTVEGWNEAFEKARREGGVARVDSTESLAVKKLAVVLKAKVDGGKDLGDYPNAGQPPLTEKGKVNFIAWAKQGKEAQHKWYAVAYKLVTNDKGFE